MVFPKKCQIASFLTLSEVLETERLIIKLSGILEKLGFAIKEIFNYDG